MTRIFHWLFLWKWISRQAVTSVLFTFPPKDNTLQYKKCVHLRNNFPCISTLVWIKHYLFLFIKSKIVFKGRIPGNVLNEVLLFSFFCDDKFTAKKIIKEEKVAPNGQCYWSLTKHYLFCKFIIFDNSIFINITWTKCFRDKEKKWLNLPLISYKIEIRRYLPKFR